MARKRGKRQKGKKKKRRDADAAAPVPDAMQKKSTAVSDAGQAEVKTKAESWLLVLVLVVLAFGFVLRFFHSSLILDSTTGFYSETGTKPQLSSINLLLSLVLLVAAALWSLFFFMRREIRLLKTGVLSGVFLAVFTLVAWIQVPIADYALPAFNTAVHATAFLLVFILVVNLGVDRRVRIALAALVFAACVAAAVAGLYEYFCLRPDVRAGAGIYTKPLVDRARAFDMYTWFKNPNVLGTVLAMGVCLGAGLVAELIRRRGSGTWRWVRLSAAGIGTALAASALLLSRSKGGIVACAIGLGTLALLVIISKIRKHADWYAYGLLGAMFLGLVVFSIGNLKSKDGSWLGASMKVRHGYWSTAGRMIKRNGLIGVGGGNYQYNYSIYKPPGAETSTLTHNSYIQLWTELGAAGLLFFFLFFASIITRVFEPHERLPAERTRSIFGNDRAIVLSIGVGAALAALISSFLISPATEMNTHFGLAVLIIFFLLLLPVNWLFREPLPKDKDEGIAGYQFFFKDSWLTAGLVAAFFAFLWHNLVDFSFYSLGVQLAFIVVAALAIVSVAPQKPQSFFVLPLGTGARYTLVIVFIAATAALGLFTMRFIRADMVFKNATNPTRLARSALRLHHKKAKDLALKSDAALDRAINLNPLDFRFYRERFYNALVQWDADYDAVAMAKLQKRKDELFSVNPNLHYDAFKFALAGYVALDKLSREDLIRLGINRRAVVAELQNARKLYPSNPERTAALWQYYARLVISEPDSKQAPTWTRNAVEFGNEALINSEAAPVKELRLPKQLFDVISKWLEKHAPKEKEEEAPEKKAGGEKPAAPEEKTPSEEKPAGEQSQKPADKKPEEPPKETGR
ncbi:MAG: O-antigen ligase domain-containing protein [Planctomycetota bacterium]|nr:MAG: O-antigen ligase domain-containing protein [Planctomycetota bacterium]